MANYPSVIGEPNAFFTFQPIVIACRNVRVIAATGEVVAEDSNSLPRQFRRILETRVAPQRIPARTIARNIPPNDTQKVAW